MLGLDGTRRDRKVVCLPGVEAADDVAGIAEAQGDEVAGARIDE
jgi:hypothetical protein